MIEYKVIEGTEENEINGLAREGWRVVAASGTRLVLERDSPDVVLGPWHSVTGDKYHFMPNCGFGQFPKKVAGTGEKLPCEQCVGLVNIALGRPWEGGTPD